MQLRAMNDEAEAGKHQTPDRRPNEPFQRAYAQVVLELKQARTRLGRTQTL